MGGPEQSAEGANVIPLFSEPINVDAMPLEDLLSSDLSNDDIIQAIAKRIQYPEQ
jgi:hypothetical protein